MLVGELFEKREIVGEGGKSWELVKEFAGLGGRERAEKREGRRGGNVQII